MQPRTYQETAINVISNALDQDENVLLQAVMGAGKTIIVCEYIRRILSLHPKGRILFLAHRAELITQARDKLLTVWPDAPRIGLACKSVDSDVVMDAQITIGSPQTLSRRIDKLPVFHLMICDEAHRIPCDPKSQYMLLIDKLRSFNPRMRVLGITATPYRFGHGYIFGRMCKKGNKNLFSKLHHQITAKELTEKGYLVPLKGKVAVDTKLVEELKSIGRSQNDFAKGELSRVMKKSIHVKNAVRAYEKYCTDRNHVMVFAVSISHAEKIHQAFLDAGHESEIIHSKVKAKDRERILTDFVAGRQKIIINVAVLIEGFDAPLTDAIIHARPTLSPALFLQTIGRGLRIAEGKKDCLLIDLVDNVKRFGTDLDDITITIPENAVKGETPGSKVCPQCRTPVAAQTLICPQCGNQFGSQIIIDPAMGRQMKDVQFHSRSQVASGLIKNVSLDYYVSSKGSEMLKLDVFCDQMLNPVSHYWSFSNNAHPYFKRKSRTWWRQVHGWDASAPKSNGEAIIMFEQDRLIGRPISIVKDGKFNRVKGW